MSPLPTPAEARAVLEQVEVMIAHLDTLQQMPSFFDLVIDDGAVSAITTDYRQSLVNLRDQGEHLVQLREQGKCRDEIWQEGVTKLEGSARSLAPQVQHLRDHINAERKKDGLPPLGSDRPLN